MASAIERSVRRALQKGNAADPEFRLRVYEAAERAILRVMTERNAGESTGGRERDELIAAIESIERDYPPAAYQAPRGGEKPSAEFAEAAPGGDDVPFAEGTPSSLPDDHEGATSDAGLDASAEDAPVTEGARSPDNSAIGPAPALASRPDDRIAAARDAWPSESPRARPVRRPSRRLAVAAVAILILLLLALAAWFIVSGAPSDIASVGSNKEVTGSRVRVASPEASADRSTQEDWIEVFAGGQIDRVLAESGGRAKVVEGEGERPAVQITGPADVDDAEIALLIGPGIVGRLAGQTVRGELTVGSPDDRSREFAIRCLFAGETACGRQRFSTTVGKETFVFDMDVPAGADGAGRLAISPGVGGNARDLNVYGLRLRPANP